MNLGDLNKIITIQRRMTEDNQYPLVDENGFPQEEWFDIAKVHCMVTNIHGKELVDNLDMMTTNSYKRMKFKYKKYLDENLNPNVTHNYRIVYKNSIWNITSIDDIKDKHEYMEVLVTKIETEWQR